MILWPGLITWDDIDITVIPRFTGPRYTVSLYITCLFVFPRYRVLWPGLITWDDIDISRIFYYLRITDHLHFTAFIFENKLIIETKISKQVYPELQNINFS